MTEKSEHFDVIIIGGGPAGLSAALWSADLGLNAILVEKEGELGGQLLLTFNAIKNYLGVEAANGRELRDRFLQHIENLEVKRLTRASVATADLAARSIGLENGRTILGRAIIIATGVRRRRLGIPGEVEFRGRGILESGVRDRAEVAGKRVVIIGGGDAALENALMLTETAAKVVVIHRRDEFSARSEFVESARNDPKVEFAFDSQVTAISGDRSVEAVEITNANTGERSKIAADAVLIRIGVVPNTELFRGQVDMDDAGYIVTTQDCATSLPGIYAAGDVANPRSLTISTAVGSAATAINAMVSWLEHR